MEENPHHSSPDDAEGLLDALLPAAISVPLSRAKETAPESLYHFTSAGAVLNIIETKTLWACLSSSSNDASEGVYARDLALSVAAQGIAGVPKGLTDAVVEQLSGAPVTPLPNIVLRVYLTSFCDTEASSSQWLHYGLAGTGMAMEFDGTKLAESPFELVKVVYDVSHQTRLISDVIATVHTAMATVTSVLSRLTVTDQFRLVAHIALQGITLLAPALKAPAFESEREWRLITFEMGGHEDVGVKLAKRFRAVGSRIVPYYERTFQSTALPLTGIVLGYASPQALLKDAFGMLSPSLIIRKSSVPVRP